MLVLALLPLFGVALGATIGADPLHLLLHERLGWGLLTAAAVLDAVGLFWVSRLVGGARPT